LTLLMLLNQSVGPSGPTTISGEKTMTDKYGYEIYRDVHLAWYKEHDMWHTYYNKVFKGVWFDRKKDAKKWLKKKTDTQLGKKVPKSRAKKGRIDRVSKNVSIS